MCEAAEAEAAEEVRGLSTVLGRGQLCEPGLWDGCRLRAAGCAMPTEEPLPQ